MLSLTRTKRGTRKYQCNAPDDWSQVFEALAVKVGGPGAKEAIGIRAALALFIEEHGKELGYEPGARERELARQEALPFTAPDVVPHAVAERRVRDAKMATVCPKCGGEECGERCRYDVNDLASKPKPKKRVVRGEEARALIKRTHPKLAAKLGSKAKKGRAR